MYESASHGLWQTYPRDDLKKQEKFCVCSIALAGAARMKDEGCIDMMKN
jgi:hypothetical protein